VAGGTKAVVGGYAVAGAASETDEKLVGGAVGAGVVGGVGMTAVPAASSRSAIASLGRAVLGLRGSRR
jgi:hypothetical protein